MQRRYREWVQVLLGTACILQQLVTVTLGRDPEIIVWSGGVALLGAGLIAFADRAPKNGDGGA
jgi:redox-regulated HSP33 family molecular chaperone